MDDLTGLFVVLAVLILIAYVKSRSDKPLETPRTSSCPPHQWELQEQPGLEGCTYHMCGKCGKTPGHLDD